MPNWSDDTQCQLCHAQTGTLEHRLVCEAIRPPEGWQNPPQESNLMLHKMEKDRKRLMETRALFAMKIRVPRPPRTDTYQWLLHPPEDMPEGCTWFIDGSLYDEAKNFGKRTGFGIAVIGPDGTLMACGNGVPPEWVSDTAGAERWAFYTVTQLCTFLPKIVTDCLGILQELKAEPQAATLPSKNLGRTWRMVAHNLDNDFEGAARNTTWMPSHGAVGTIRQTLDSNGAAISSIMWRANRLVDDLAKAAAGAYRLPKFVMKAVKDAAATVLPC